MSQKSFIVNEVSLALQMAYGYRPTISKDIPQVIADLIEDCWEDNPDDRPTAAKVAQTLAAVGMP
jgi:hypothetical protein